MIPAWLRALLAGLAFAMFSPALWAQVPSLINYQGRVVVGGTNFTGLGYFKFALVNADSTITFWSNDGTSINGSEPSASVTQAVSKGLFALQLGDTNLVNMTPVPQGIFTNGDVRLRLWFDDGSGFHLLSPDQRITAVGYAMFSAAVQDGAVTVAKLGADVDQRYVHKGGDTMTGPLNLPADGLAVGTNQLAAVSNRVGIGTSTPSAKLEVVGGSTAGEYVFKIVSGTNLIAWGRKKQ